MALMQICAEVSDWSDWTDYHFLQPSNRNLCGRLSESWFHIETAQLQRKHTTLGTFYELVKFNL